MSNILIVTFAQDQDIKALAQKVAAASDADTFEVAPVAPYPRDERLRRARMVWESSTHMFPYLDEVPDLAPYDAVLLGSSDCMSYLMPPVAALAARPEMAGKTVGVFTTATLPHAQLIAERAEDLAPKADHLNALRPVKGVLSDEMVAAWCRGVRAACPALDRDRAQRPAPAGARQSKAA